jgi:hypothetical protein
MKRFTFCLVACAALLALAAVRPARGADYASTVMGFNPVAYWQLNTDFRMAHPRKEKCHRGSLLARESHQ